MRYYTQDIGLFSPTDTTTSVIACTVAVACVIVTFVSWDSSSVFLNNYLAQWISDCYISNNEVFVRNSNYIVCYSFRSNFEDSTEHFPSSKEGERANSAAVIINPKNGHLLAVAGEVGKKRSDRIFNLATQMLRSPGSVIKPISVYAPAFENDLITWASVYDDVPVTFLSA